MILANGGGSDTVNGFTGPITNPDGSFTGVDQINVSALTDAGSAPVDTADVVVSDDGNGNAVLTFPSGTNLTLIGISPDAASDPLYLNAMGIPLGSTLDGLVEGTGGGDLINSSYMGDPDGDRIDNSDAILPGAAPNDDLVFGGAGTDTIEAGLGNDEIYGGAGVDLIFGGAGNDTIDASGLPLYDIMYGGDGNDVIIGGDSTDTLSGDGGDDSLTGNAGADFLSGGDGQDTLYGGDGTDAMQGGAGDDELSGGAGNDTLNGDAGADTILGGANDDTIQLSNDFGNDVIQGGETSETMGDRLNLSNVTQNLTIDLTSADAEAGTVSNGTSTASFAEIENVILGSGIDTLVLANGSGADHVNGFAGPISNGTGGFTGVDQLNVAGLTDLSNNPVDVNDVVVSNDGSGNAVLTFPGGESIRLTGISPTNAMNPDYLVAMGIPAAVPLDGIVDGTAGSDVIDTAYTGDPEGDRIDNGDALLPGAAPNDDYVLAGDGADTVQAGLGNDEVYGGDGADSLFGGAGADTIYGDAGNDYVDGGDGDDQLFGGADNDTLVGNAGNDTLDSGSGRRLCLRWRPRWQ